MMMAQMKMKLGRLPPPGSCNQSGRHPVLIAADAGKRPEGLAEGKPMRARPYAHLRKALMLGAQTEKPEFSTVLHGRSDELQLE
jgi:hypothetical protein